MQTQEMTTLNIRADGSPVLIGGCSHRTILQTTCETHPIDIFHVDGSNSANFEVACRKKIGTCLCACTYCAYNGKPGVSHIHGYKGLAQGSFVCCGGSKTPLPVVSRDPLPAPASEEISLPENLSITDIDAEGTTPLPTTEENVVPITIPHMRRK